MNDAAKAKDRARSKAHYHANRDRYLKSRAQARTEAMLRDPEGERAKGAAQSRKWAAQNPERNRAKRRRGRLMHEYGLTEHQYAEIVAWFEGLCACCGTHEPGAIKGWALDHDHNSGQIRGVICQPCNKLLGLLGDDAKSIAIRTSELLAYLARSGDGEVA